MSSFLYYRMDAPVLGDDEYDRLSEEVAASWESLEPYRKWCLGGSLKAMLATGYHYRISTACACGALAWHRATHGQQAHDHLLSSMRPVRDWKNSKKWAVRYVVAGG